MAWRDLAEDLAELFEQSTDDREIDARNLARARRAPPRDPPPHTKTGRVLLAVVGGARTPAAVAVVTGLHRLDVVAYLKVLRQHGRVSHAPEGWIV